MKKKSVRLMKGGICGVRTQRRSHHNHTGHPVETSGCRHATFGFRRAPSCSYSMNVVVHIGKQRLSKPRDCHQILTSSRTVQQRQNNDLRFCLPCEKCEWMVRSTGAGARKLFERIVRRRRDMQRLIPYRTRGTVARPASGHSCRPTSL